MKKFFAEFKKFITRGNVVDMAIGVAVAGAFTKIVNAFTKGFVSPLIGIITGDANLSDLKWIYREAVEAQPAVPAVIEVDPVTGVETVVKEAVPAVEPVTEIAFLWGEFVQMILDFIIIAFILFVVMRVFNKLAEKAKEAADDIRLTDEEKAAIEAGKKAEAEKKAAEEAKAKAEAEEAARKAKEEKEAQLAAYAAQVELNESTQKLLGEIRDILKNK